MEKEQDEVKTRSMDDGTTITEYPSGVEILTPADGRAYRLPTKEEVQAALDKAIAERYAKAQEDRGKVLPSDDKMSSVRFTR